MNLPNKLTCLRVLLIPVFLIFLYIGAIPYHFLLALVVFAAASITDALDGKIARARGLVTNFGKFLDPIADKILVVAAMILFVEMGRLPAWIPIIVIFREFAVSGYRLIAVQNSGKVIAANVWGKLKTVTQMLGLIIALIDVNSFGKFLDGSLSGINLIINIASTMMLLISVIATIFSGWEYIKNGKDLLSDK